MTEEEHYQSASHIPNKHVERDIKAVKDKLTELEGNFSILNVMIMAKSRFVLGRLEGLLAWREKNGIYIPTPDEEGGQPSETKLKYDF